MIRKSTKSSWEKFPKRSLPTKVMKARRRGNKFVSMAYFIPQSQEFSFADRLQELREEFTAIFDNPGVELSEEAVSCFSNSMDSIRRSPAVSDSLVDSIELD